MAVLQPQVRQELLYLWQALVQETEARRVLPGGMEEATYRTPVPEALLPRAQVRVSVRARP
jgi:hypothetical protein